ncbi:MAG: hypothetical protein EBU70_13830 [Actinobacteria bacterium]|nr:hypothetical protein [Actinomycetota bacterium]
MTDPIDAVRHAGPLASADQLRGPAAAASRPAEGTDALLASARASIDRARVLGAEAERAISSPQGAAMDDVEGILRATMKADAAFRMLEAARNAMLEAYARTAGPATGR